MQTETSIEEVSVSRNIREADPDLWRRILGIGIVTIILGAAAILLPFMATLTVNVLLGIILLVAALAHAIHAFSCRDSKEMILRVLAAAVYGAAGILLLVFPRQGMLALTILLAVLFIVIGALKLALALSIQPIRGWGWLAFSGILAAGLGVLIWAGLPSAATWVIGLLIGIELLVGGWTIVVSALAMRELSESRTAPAGTLR
jgi:uncharacterized membrane protein HdeD (DUF308 family)